MQGAPDVTQVSSVYGEGKRAEKCCPSFRNCFRGAILRVSLRASAPGSRSTVILRFGNFIRDVLDGHVPHIRGLVGPTALSARRPSQSGFGQFFSGA